ncbi:RiPP maturation radical SAM C-methyltransferase [Scytonema sp. NUACC26]|uniref:RiPP maturation radical SAM C-methyltransferase n=1 Tax=Scytonema sp. NUACC26 TaxID=3140176 RepID=UPI0034DC63AF
MTDVCLVLMPYASIERPSIALGLLKACLQQSEIQTAVLYPNIWFAQEIGLDVYTALSDVLVMDFLGEWTFSGTAFPDFQPDHSEYFRLIKSIDADLTQEIFWQVRKKATLFIERVAQSILDLQPRIVGCSSTFQQHCASLGLLRRIRELNPEVITFMGGANCEAEMGLTTHREFPWVDFIVSGEGDDLLPKFCRQLLDRGRDVNPTKLPYGVIAPAHRYSSAVGIKAPRASAEKLDRIPTPDYDDYFETLRTSQIAPYIKPGLLIETARGCWWGQKHHCTFCGLNGSGMTFRSKSPTRVMEEVTELTERYGMRKFEVVDNILDMDYMNTVLPALAAEEEPYTIFYETKANLSREHMQQLAKAGVRWIQPGIENMHDGPLKLINKGTTAWVNTQLLKWAREFGINVAWNFLSNLPGELDEWYSEMAAWLPLIVHLQPPAFVFGIRYDRFSPYHERSADWGLTLLPNRMYSYIYPVSLEALAGLAYFFEDSADLVRPDLVSQKHDRNGKKTDWSGLEALKAWVKQWGEYWQVRYSRPEDLPILSMSDDGNCLTITDTRPCATERLLSLEGLAYWVYKVCDRALTPRELVKALRTQAGINISWDDVQLIVAQLQERKILVDLNGRLLSLAVKEPYLPLPTRSEFPGGYVDIDGFCRSKRKPRTLLETWGFAGNGTQG